MNKTVKTIAWICLVLGLMGVAVDAGVYVRGRMWASEIQEAIASGEMPGPGGRVGKGSENSGVDSDGREDRQPNRDGQPGSGRKGGGLNRSGDSVLFSGRRRGRMALPLLLLLAGPVLTVVGAVMLLVNREPKQKKTEKTKNNTKKTTKSTKETKTNS